MKKRKGHGIDHVWQFVKYNGDAAYYARCKCGFRYACDTTPAPEKLYYYCPICGARKKWYNEEVKKIDKYSFE